jgi:TetR/AcrR family transcriptional regulator, cholesterol catabolism regulator
MVMEAKERIMVKADELFMKYGIRSVSMDDIANSLGMSKKTLYQYYGDKDELVDAVVEAHIKKMQTDCVKCRKDAKDAIHEIFIAMDRILEQFNNMNPMLVFDLEKFHFRSYERFREYKDTFLGQMISENIEWGIEDELYRPELDIDLISKFRLESMMIPFDVSEFPPGKYNVAELSAKIMEHFVYGLATIKGHKLIQKYNQQRQKKLSYEERK